MEGKNAAESEKRLGCGLYVSTFPTGARTMTKTLEYQHEDTLTICILLGE